MKIQLELFRLLGEIVEGIGVPKPKILAKNAYAARNTVMFGFDGSNLPYAVISGGPILPKTFYGDDLQSADLAEHKALMSLVEHLKQTYGTQIHDISHSKLKACELKCLEILSAMENFVERFRVFLNKYESCTNDLLSLLSTASEKLGQVVDEVTVPVKEMVENSITSIEDVKHKLLNAGFETNAYRIGIASNDKMKTNIIFYWLPTREN